MLPEEIVNLTLLTMSCGFLTAYASVYISIRMELINFKWNPWTTWNFFGRLIVLHGYALLHATFLSLLLLGVPSPLLIPEIIELILFAYLTGGLLIHLTLFCLLELATIEL